MVSIASGGGVLIEREVIVVQFTTAASSSLLFLFVVTYIHYVLVRYYRRLPCFTAITLPHSLSS
jgi:hypothetical protein